MLFSMQVQAFQSLLEKYQDYATNPGAESSEKIRARLKEKNSCYYFIVQDETVVGAMRIQDRGNRCRVSPIYILPEFQGCGYAQQAMHQAEKLYSHAVCWELDTIREEPKLCHLYEKLGYRRTGKEIQIQPGMTIVIYEKMIQKRKDEENGNL